MKKRLLAGISTAVILSSGIISSATAQAAVSHSASSSQSYKEAVKQGSLLSGKTAAYINTIKGGDISKISSSYTGLTLQVKNTEKAAGKVAGSSNRAALLNKYVKPAKIQVERTIYEVSEYRLLSSMKTNISDDNYQIDDDMNKLQRLKKRAVQIKQAGGYQALPDSVNRSLHYREADTEGSFLKTIVDSYTYLADEEGDIYTMDYIYDYFNFHKEQADLKIGQVSGASNRSALIKKYINPAKIAYERTKYEISRLRLIYKISDLADQKKIDEAKKEAEKLQRLKDRAAAIKKAGGYKDLNPQVYEYLQEDEKLALELLN
ncbi:hypothetical protein [Metabacillus sp. RGM 3146]|uniref:hypothetical protein n=1 Tax=Metabacillus sp. RGM 3146 TaxID=3401092 RepID=UPI003B999802